MRPAVLCLLLLSGCELEAARNYRTYELTWSCVSPEGCERMEQVELIDRAKIINGSDFVDFSSSRDGRFSEFAQIVSSDALPAECSWLYDLALFAYELEPSRFCRTSGSFELELSIPNRDSMSHSKWLVEGRDMDS
jgi:hypothetical protein